MDLHNKKKYISFKTADNSEWIFGTKKYMSSKTADNYEIC